MADPFFKGGIETAIHVLFPHEADTDKAKVLVTIWSDVLQAIIERANKDFFSQAENLHIDLKPEITVALTNTVLGLGKEIVAARTVGKALSEIDPKSERRFHESNVGQSHIEATANMMTRSWLKRYKERWEPKTVKKLELEANPRPTKPRTPKAVEDNHFISKFYLKKYWADGVNLYILQRNEPLEWKVRQTTNGGWGHEKRLYSDRLEDRFSLIEGDAETPIKKMLDFYPLNDPERLALLGYLIVQKIRNPSFRRRVIQGTLPVAVEFVGEARANDPEFQKAAFETIFENNKFYDEISRPLYWSKWMLIESAEPVFVLPDTFCIMESGGKRSILIVPLTPRICFVATGILEKKKRALPHLIKDEILVAALSDCLLAYVEREAVVHSTFVPPVKIGSRSKTLSAVLELIDLAVSTEEAPEEG